MKICNLHHSVANINNLHPLWAQGEQTCPSLFLQPLFCELSFHFSITLFYGHPPKCAYLRPQTELKMPSHASWCQQQQLAATASTEWANMSFHFLQPLFCQLIFFNTLLFKLCYNKFHFAQFEQQSKWAYVWNHSTSAKKLCLGC